MTKCPELLILGLATAFISCSQSNSTPQTEPVPAGGDTVVQVCKIAAELMGVKRQAVNPSTSLADLGADELDTVELVMELEDHFNVTIPDEALSSMTGDNNWQVGFENITMNKFAEIIDKQNR